MPDWGRASSLEIARSSTNTACTRSPLPCASAGRHCQARAGVLGSIARALPKRRPPSVERARYTRCTLLESSFQATVTIPCGPTATAGHCSFAAPARRPVGLTGLDQVRPPSAVRASSTWSWPRRRSSNAITPWRPRSAIAALRWSCVERWTGRERPNGAALTSFPRWRRRRGRGFSCTSRQSTPSTWPFSHGPGFDGSGHITPEPGRSACPAIDSRWRLAGKGSPGRIGSRTTQGITEARPGRSGWPTRCPRGLDRPRGLSTRCDCWSAEKS